MTYSNKININNQILICFPLYLFIPDSLNHVISNYHNQFNFSFLLKVLIIFIKSSVLLILVYWIIYIENNNYRVTFILQDNTKRLYVTSYIYVICYSLLPSSLSLLSFHLLFNSKLMLLTQCLYYSSFYLSSMSFLFFSMTLLRRHTLISLPRNLL